MSLFPCHDGASSVILTKRLKAFSSQGRLDRAFDLPQEGQGGISRVVVIAVHHESQVKQYRQES
jgi:hypothetical protein